MRDKKYKIKNLLKGLSRYKENNTYYFLEKVSEKEEKYIIDNINQKNDNLMFLLYSQLNTEEKRYVDLQFKERFSVNTISQILFISPSTFHRRMDDIYTKLIKYMNQFEELF